MMKRLLKIHIGMIAVLFALSFPVMATESVHNGECSANDLRQIKAFDIRVKAKTKRFNELVASSSQVVNERDAKEFTEDFERIKAFFRSDKFKAMEAIYKKCDRKLSKPNI